MLRQQSDSSRSPDADRAPLFQSPHAALKALRAGNYRFATDTAKRPHQELTRLTQLIGHQAPFATIVTCADSRVSPELLFDYGMGDLFTIRVAGNVLTASELGTVEYGVQVLNTPLLMVLGHSGCGAVKAALESVQPSGNIKTLIQAIRPAVNRIRSQPGDRWDNAVRANVIFQTEQLLKNPAVAERLTAQSLIVVGGYFDFATGRVSILTILTTAHSSIQPNYINTY